MNETESLRDYWLMKLLQRNGTTNKSFSDTNREQAYAQQNKINKSYLNYSCLVLMEA